MGLIESNMLPIAWAALILCGLGLAWALLWDRPRGRLRCRRCRYRMEGSPPAADGSFTCPECGRLHRHERRLRYTRRRWWPATLALLTALTSWYAIDYHWRFRERGWWGYAPTTAILLLPSTAKTWMDAHDAPAGTRLESEVAYRVHTVGITLWQEHLWVRSLRREAAARASGTWQWRFLEKSRPQERAWERHRCSSPCSMLRSRCPGDGALQLQTDDPELRASWGWETGCAFHFAAAAQGLEVQAARYKFAQHLPTVSFATSDWDWPVRSAYESYFTDERGQRIVEQGLSIHAAPPNWQPDIGWVGTPDRTVVYQDVSCVIRKFDLRAIHRAAGISDQSPQSEEDRWRFANWLAAETGIDVTASGSGDWENPIVSWAFKSDLYIMSTTKVQDDAAKTLQSLYARVHPGCWMSGTD